MSGSGIVVWEDRMTRLSFVLLFLAVLVGLGAGSAVTMYYDIVPDIGQIEDQLSPFLLLLFIAALLPGFIHLPLLVGDFRRGLWKQALTRTAVFLAPFIIFLGTEGLLSHFLWWGPLSDTDRFHMLHHTIVAGLPLTLLYGLGLWRWWRPDSFTATETLSRRAWIVVTVLLIWMISFIGIPIGIIPLPLGGLLLVGGFIVLVVLWWKGRVRTVS